jgi:effector-binding domain-containing protein
MMVQEKITSQMLVASSQHFVKVVSDKLIEQFTNDFERYLAEIGAQKKEPQNFFVVFHVDAYRDEDYEMELWVQVEASKQNTDSITFKLIPETDVAYIIISENYENFQFAYDALFNYVQERDFIVNGYPRETYILDDNAPLGYFTEIQLPFSRETI